MIWPRGYNTFFMLNSTEHEIFLLINVKMPTIVGILTFMSGKIAFLAYMSLKKAEFLDIFILMSIQSFMLNWVEHEKSFITLGPELWINDFVYLSCLSSKEFTPWEANSFFWEQSPFW